MTDGALTDALVVNEVPKHHHDCCVAISKPLLDSLLHFLPSRPALVLSVGCGTGYLEAMLLQAVDHDSLDLIGLEVSSHVNKYLPEENFHAVNGTWDVSALATSARALLFVYPREPRLVARYLDYVRHSSCDTVIWIGPSLDWPDYQSVFTSSDFSQVLYHEQGMAVYEMLVVASKASAASKT